MTFDLEITGAGFVAQGWMTGEPITPQLGYGGHPIGARPKRKSLTVYEGRQPFQVEVPMLLYRGVSAKSHGQEESVEKDRKALEAMGVAEEPSGVGFGKTHPVSLISPAGVPLPIPVALLEKNEWWIEDLKWGEEKRNPLSFEVDPGHIVRKNVTVTLLEVVTDETLGSGETKHSSKARARKYKVKKGDTLASIAKAEVGGNIQDAIAKIKKLNSIRSDGELSKRVGKEIHLPPRATPPPKSKSKTKAH